MVSSSIENRLMTSRSLQLSSDHDGPSALAPFDPLLEADDDDEAVLVAGVGAAAIAGCGVVAGAADEVLFEAVLLVAVAVGAGKLFLTCFFASPTTPVVEAARVLPGGILSSGAPVGFLLSPK